jgi:hypothetical protein
MEQQAFPTLAVVLVVGVVVAAMLGGILRILRKPAAELTGMDRLIGYMVVGRYFTTLHARVSERGYRLSEREKWGLGLLLGFLALIILGVIAYGYRHA